MVKIVLWTNLLKITCLCLDPAKNQNCLHDRKHLQSTLLFNDYVIGKKFYENSVQIDI